MESHRFRRNAISGLKTETGEVVSGIVLNKFKDMMGRANGISMGFDLSTLLQPVEGLDELTRPFEKE